VGGDGGNTLLKGRGEEATGGGGVWAMRTPRDAGRTWGLAPTSGRRPVRPWSGHNAHRRHGAV
jgi:hypothetical protein